MLKSVMMAFAVTLGTVFAQEINVIPKPAEVIKGTGTFKLTSRTKIVASKDAVKTAKQLRDFLKPATGFSLNPKSFSNKIVLNLNKKAELDKEGYTLKVTPGKVVITAKTEAGLYYGCQTLRQLLPPQIFADKPQKNIKWTIPAVTIKDQPRFGWRGMMLDSSRHFQTVEYIKKFIDRLAMQKLNIFHWHIVDGHGWRLAVKKYPRLTDVGAWRPATSDWSLRWFLYSKRSKRNRQICS